MFGRKKQPLPGLGRQRPAVTPERRNSAVFSYHAARSVRPESTNPGRAAEPSGQSSNKGAAAERRDVHSSGLRRSATLIGGVLLCIVLLSSLFLGTEPKVVTAAEDAPGALFLRDTSVYRQAAAGLLRGSPLNRTKLTVNSRHISAQLEREFPELAQVAVSLPAIGYQPVLHLTPAVPALIMSTTGGQSYVLDTTGRALLTPAQAPAVGKLGLPVVTDQSGLPVQPGRVALPGSTTRFIAEVVGQLKAAHVTITSLTLPKATSELDVRIQGAPYYVKLNLMGDARVGAGSFLAVKQQLERDHKAPGTYIDVRVDGRAYYK